ncbi:hypothetical protein MJO29_012420 [Puccinia striiformis f. sp. tritici]|nr:hypothetical protein MJO29_012420 [Puccinia striiformis f. sp. tritici]
MSALPDINIASRSLNRPHSGEYSTLRRRTTCHRRSRPALKKAMVSSAKDIDSNMSIANNDGPFVPEEADVKPTINPSKAASWEAIRAEILRRSPPKDGKGVPVGGYPVPVGGYPPQQTGTRRKGAGAGAGVQLLGQLNGGYPCGYPPSLAGNIDMDMSINIHMYILICLGLSQQY